MIFIFAFLLFGVIMGIFTGLYYAQFGIERFSNELGTCEAYGTDPRYPGAPPKSERSYRRNVTRTQCFRDCWIDKEDPNRAVLPGGVRIFHPNKN